MNTGSAILCMENIKEMPCTCHSTATGSLATYNIISMLWLHAQFLALLCHTACIVMYFVMRVHRKDQYEKINSICYRLN